MPSLSTSSRSHLRLRAAILAILAALPPAALQAEGGPPLLTEDPGTPGAGNWEINVAHTRERRAGDTVSARPVLDFNYGWGERVQLKLEGSFLARDAVGEPRGTGPGRVLGGVKWRFCDEDHHGVAIATFPQVAFRAFSSSAAQRGLVPDENSLALPLEFQRSFGFGSVGVEFGHILNSKSSAGWLHGIAVQVPLGRSLTLGAELHGETDRRFRRSNLVANLVLHASVTTRTALLFALGREMHNHDEPRATLLYVGVQVFLSSRSPIPPKG